MATRVATRALLALLAAVPALFAASCSSVPREPDPDWQRTTIEAPSDRVLWKIGLQALRKMRFPIGSGLDPSSMSVTSGWRMDLQPFSGAGTRMMAELRMSPVARGQWRVEARVKKQVNKALTNPLDPKYAEWEWEPDDAGMSVVLLQHMRSSLTPTITPSERAEDPLEAWREERGEREESP